MAAFACHEPDGSHFNRFDAGDINVIEGTGTHKVIRRLD